MVRDAIWSGEDRQRELDIKIVEYCLEHGTDPIAALKAPVFNIPKDVWNEMYEQKDQS